MINGTFRWELYEPAAPIVKPRLTRKAIAEFKEHYLATHEIEETTWQESWRRTLDRLPQAGGHLSD